MDTHDTCVSLLVMAGTMLLTACCRRLARQFARRKPQIYSFLLELTGAFQVSACTHEICLLAELPPKPQMALALTYIVTVLHGLLLPDSVVNPASSFQLLCSNKVTVKNWGLQTSAQFTGAVVANVYIKLVWKLGIISAHSRALGMGCSDPIQTTIAHAFMLELLFSFLLHLTVLQFESMEHKKKVHLIALLIVTFVYGGGHLTGAIFNPALAFSLHLVCFLDEFWSHTLVYCIAPFIGSLLVVIIWDEVIPHISSQFN